MITREKPLSLAPGYRGNALPQEGDLLFFDIETTGFSPKTAHIYLIGAVVKSKHQWHLIQWLAQSPQEEALLLQSFLTFAAPFSGLIHFNGTTFDLPFLRQRASLYSLALPEKGRYSLDLLRMIRPYRKVLGLEHLNQTALEDFLGIRREDSMDGGRLIPVYHQYTNNLNPELANLLLLHNHDDLMGMVQLLPLLSYADFFSGKFSVEGCEPDREDASAFSLIFHLALESPLPKPLSLPLSRGYLKAENASAGLLVQGRKGEMKHFFENYRDYYYLPAEDTAIHKSVGTYVDREHRVPAKAATCYTRKSGLFLPFQGDADDLSLFSSSHRDGDTYLECTPQFIADPDLQLRYCRSLIRNCTNL